MADSGGGGKRKIAGTTPPPLNRVVASAFGDHGKILLLPPTPPPHYIASAFGDHGKFLLLPPTESRRLSETTDKFCYYPPPTESRRLGTSHERGRPLRKILDLRLHTTVTIGVVYRCPNITKQNNEKIHNAISEVSKGECIIMGDFNHGNIKWDTQQSTGVEDQQFLCLVQDNFLTQHVLEPTRAAYSAILTEGIRRQRCNTRTSGQQRS